MTENPDLDRMQDYEDIAFFEQLDDLMERIDKIPILLDQEKTMNKDYEVDTDIWETKLKEANNDGGGIYVFPQVGTTKVRLLVSPECKTAEFYQPVSRMFRDQEKTQYMCPVIVTNDGVWNMEVRYLNMNKTVFKGILAILAGGEYDLLSPDGGHAIQITRTGEGLKTRYAVMPSKDPVPLDYAALTFEKELSEYVRDLEASDRKDKSSDVKEDFPF